MRRIGWLLSMMGVGLLTLAASAAAMFSEDCLGCHAEADMVGVERQLDVNRYDHTAHAELGCPTCHESVSAQHPDDGVPPSRAVCGDCHQQIDGEYASTPHAENAGCGDCHNPHIARSTSEVSGVDMNRQCGACHAAVEMSEAHGLWLPQANLHLEMLPCISCHTASENYVIVLYLSGQKTAAAGNGKPGLASYDELKAAAGESGISSLIDSDANGFVSLAELKQFNTGSKADGLRLKGMMTPEVVTHDLKILDNRWDCTFCHASGPGTMQTSLLALPQDDGSYVRLPVEKGAVLDALYGTPDFYMMGATRNTSLDLFGLVILAGGLVMPIGHGTLRFFTRKNRQ